MVAPAFGFSVGDFIAGIQVAKKAFDALDDTRGATSEYQAAALELDKLDALLRRVQAFDGQDVDADILHLLTILAKTCQIPVLKFLKKIEPLKKHLSAATSRKGSLSGIAKSAAAKFKWALLVKDALVELKASIAPCLIDIDILLQLIAMYGLHKQKDWPELANGPAANTSQSKARIPEKQSRSLKHYSATCKTLTRSSSAAWLDAATCRI
ncbi:hypothetical protein HII31_05580 [Pseudocercospora fuligena]|uniref:Fungal N-terminal domain-containing protein n=1 Tax=Pseudocercospora fuligena TaxID=685502 RepID=A0A8H6VHY3_9PEZI|nr:hypothetical protein HII31_05580 [Pseudocercospora fuligena]